MEYSKEYNDVKLFFLNHINERLDNSDPLYDRFEIISYKILGAGYLYYIINDTQENILYEIYYDVNRNQLAIDYSLFKN